MSKKELSPAQLKQRRDAAKKAEKNKTGPITKEGKARAAMNHFIHGQTARSARAKMMGKPCLSTCSKFKDCSFIKAGKTKPGGKCLDIIDWEIIEDTAEAVIEAQHGDMSKMQGLAGLLVGQDMALLQHIFGEIHDRGLWVTSDIIDSEGGVIGKKEEVNPLIEVLMKLQKTIGVSLPEFLATPQSQAKVVQEENAQQTAAEFTRNMARLLPQDMAVPHFSPDEVADAEVVKEGEEKQ